MDWSYVVIICFTLLVISDIIKSKLNREAKLFEAEAKLETAKRRTIFEQRPEKRDAE